MPGLAFVSTLVQILNFELKAEYKDISGCYSFVIAGEGQVGETGAGDMGLLLLL
jgi:hypothetical protein